MMNTKLNKSTNSKEIWFHFGIIFFLTLFLVFLTIKGGYIFGSNMDWMKQHSVLPDYFRNLFYQTGNLFPNFAPQLGGGQNIFYLAYYGLYNPFILLSYLFPFIPMGIYIMIISILVVLVSVYLFYYFLKLNHFSNKICLFTSLLFLSASCFLFHSHRHIMFVSYMPFLILAFIGVISYFDKKKSTLLVVSIFLMILTSYYYSIPGMISICLYALYYYLKKEDKITLKGIIHDGFFFLFRILLGILLASMLLLPLVYVILNGRSSGTSSISLDLNLLKPNISLDYIMYGTYGIGLTAIFWLSIIYHIVVSKKEYKVVSILLLILFSFPIFNFILNGRLYLNGKVFIPLLPLGAFLIASMINSTNFSKNMVLKVLLGLIISIFLITSNGYRTYYFYIELMITFFLLLCYQKKKKILILLPILIASFITCYYNNINDDLVSITDYQKQLSYNKFNVLDYINQNTSSIYRFQDDLSGANGINYSYGKLDYRTTLYSSTSNSNYSSNFYNAFNNNDIYRNYLLLAQTNNLFFQRYMGIRYLLTDNNPPSGYQKINSYQNGSLYENKNVYPIGFSMTNLLSYKDYEKLSFIEKLEAFQNNVIINGSSKNSNLDFSNKKIDLDYEVVDTKNISYEKKNNGYLITSKKNGKITLKLNESIVNNSLIIRFQMNDIPSCKNGDTAITINQVMNKLTCKTWKYYNHNEVFDYVISSNDEIKELELEFSKGNYDITDIEIYEIPNDFFQKDNGISPLVIDFDKTKGDYLKGTINVVKDSYFVFTIPYDNGFNILVDGKKIEYEKVNDMFIGFPITEGNHTIEYHFRAPLRSIGMIITMISGIILVGLTIYEKKQIKYNENEVISWKNH